MSTVTVALLQMAPHGADQAANLAKGEAFCRRAREMGADLALFPEMWNIGYTAYPGCPNDLSEIGQETPEQVAAREAWQAQAVARDGPFVRRFQRLARDLGMAIAITYLERWPGAPRNTMSLIDRSGEIVLTYAKVHTCDFGLEAACTPGDAFPVAALDTGRDTVQVGAMICYDREFPESARLLMLEGAEIIVVPNACELDGHRLAQFRTRAYENMVGLAMANYAANPGDERNGHSIAVHPMAFDHRGRSQDTLIVEAGEEEGVYLAPFDLAAIRAYRARETWGNAFRRPHRYGALTALEVRAPFVRRNASGERYDPAAR